MLEGLWSDLFGSSLYVAIERNVPIHCRFRRIAETTEAKEELDGTDCESQSFLCFDYIVSAILAINVSWEDHHQEAHKQTRQSEVKIWYAPPEMALDELMLTCTTVASHVGVNCQLQQLGLLVVTNTRHHHPNLVRCEQVGFTLISSNPSRLHAWSSCKTRWV